MRVARVGDIRWFGSGLWLGGDFDFDAIEQFFAGIGDNAIIGGEAANDFEFLAEVLADGDGAKVNMVLIVDDGDLRAVGFEEHGGRWDGEHGVIVMDAEANFAVHPRPEEVVVIVEIKFGEEGARGRIEDSGGAGDDAGELAVAVVALSDEMDGFAGLDGTNKGLRDVDVNAQAICVGDVEHFMSGGGIGGGDAGADVIIAEGDGSGKGSGDLFESLLGDEAVHRGLCAFDGGIGGGLFGGRLVRGGFARVQVLLGHAAGCEQAVIAIVGGIGERKIGGSFDDVGLRLLQRGAGCASSASVSGASISASSWPFSTWSLMSTIHRFM